MKDVSLARAEARRSDWPGMNPLLLKTIHVAAALGVFTALGAIVAGGCERCRKMASILHGISLLIVLAVGLHMLFSAKLQSSGGWWHAKLVLWLFLGAAPALAKREALSKPLLMGLCLLAGIGATYLGLNKPF